MYSCYSLLDLVKAMLYLIDHPDFDSPNNSFGILSDLAQLPTMTTRVLAGLSVKGRRFLPNAAWFEWARDNGCLFTEEEEVGESRNAIGIMGQLDHKGSEVIVAYTNTAASEDDKDSANETVDAPSDTASDTVPSFARIRYLFDPEDESFSWDPYAARWSPFEVESHRGLIWHPANDHNTDAYSVFYFIEFLGTEHHRNELGEHYNTLFIGNVLPQDGKGKQALFGGLFLEDNRRRGNFTCFLDEDGDDDGASQCIARLFDSAYSDQGRIANTRVHESDEEIEEPTSFASSSAYKDVRVPYPTITDFFECRHEYDYIRGSVNAGLDSEWKWFLHRTRWSIRFNPQQNVDLSMAGILVPPWRASLCRMLSDI
ncbi:unnamed protein product [Taenia asiatica]|uniref:Similar to n=1 Tax=Taenia asiatica TaxID=60517 RepID=A0A0R3WF73_TAEAS|nr:unnamed protein product [Taenia asiatica]